MKRIYVYPNVSEFNKEVRVRRSGSLNARWGHALQTARELQIECQLIEVPAHFIKSRNDIAITGLPPREILTSEAISTLYDNADVSQKVRYILHSEFRDSLNHWWDQEWVQKLVEMLILISKRLGVPPEVVEIHPGGTRNSRNLNVHIIKGSRLLIERYEKEFSHQPSILLENRTKQFISNGGDLDQFWKTAQNEGRDIIAKLGIVLDVQQLFTSVNHLKEDFLDHFNRVPDEAIKGIHIHARRNQINHQLPTKEDPIPWRQVFSRLRNLNQPLIINPEVLQHYQVRDTIRFCENMWNKEKDY